MFDPTAYENIKVVLEGMIYDQDLNHKIKVVERNDIINLADLSRKFSMTMVHLKDKHEKVQGKMEISADFVQLTSEWMPMGEEPGADLLIEFTIDDPLNEVLEKRIRKSLKQKYSLNFSLRWEIQTDSEDKTIYRFILNKYQPVTERTITEISEEVEKTVEFVNELFDMIKNQ